MSSPSCVHRTTCLLCGSEGLERAVEYPPTPIADAYLNSAAASAIQPRHGLSLYLCVDCGLVQLRDVVDPLILFGDTRTETSVSPGLVAHFEAYAEAITAYACPAPSALTVEIGSNDGSLLRFFQARGLRVVGVDPAVAIAERATRSGVETIPAFFSLDVARAVRARLGEAAIVAANNVFAHSEALAEMADGVHHLLANDGVFVFEVSYLPDILERKLFDTVYHEHLCYHSVIPMQRFLAAHGLELVDFVPLKTKGGSFRGVAQRAGGSRPSCPGGGAAGRLRASESLPGAGDVPGLRQRTADREAEAARHPARASRRRSAHRRLRCFSHGHDAAPLL